jgi:hypothetical protein
MRRKVEKCVIIQDGRGRGLSRAVHSSFGLVKVGELTCGIIAPEYNLYTRVEAEELSGGESLCEQGEGDIVHE